MIDNQGRCVITDHGAFVLFNCYGPAVTNITNDRFAFKMQFYEVTCAPALLRGFLEATFWCVCGMNSGIKLGVCFRCLNTGSRGC